MNKAAAAALIIAVSFAGSAWAGPLEDGWAAYRSGAEKGNADAQESLGFMYAGAGALSTPDIAERAKSFTVQVICAR